MDSLPVWGVSWVTFGYFGLELLRSDFEVTVLLLFGSFGGTLELLLLIFILFGVTLCLLYY